jgi:hypothetical protein
MAFVEEDHGEDFALECAKFESEVVARLFRAGELRAAPYAKGHLLT